MIADIDVLQSPSLGLGVGVSGGPEHKGKKAIMLTSTRPAATLVTRTRMDKTSVGDVSTSLLKGSSSVQANRGDVEPVSTSMLTVPQIALVQGRWVLQVRRE